MRRGAWSIAGNDGPADGKQGEPYWRASVIMKSRHLSEAAGSQNPHRPELSNPTPIHTHTHTHGMHTHGTHTHTHIPPEGTPFSQSSSTPNLHLSNSHPHKARVSSISKDTQALAVHHGLTPRSLALTNAHAPLAAFISRPLRGRADWLPALPQPGGRGLGWAASLQGC